MRISRVGMISLAGRGGSATRLPRGREGGREGDVSPGGSRRASIASCKVTAVKFSAPPLNFSGIPIYSAARIYLFRASSLSLSLARLFPSTQRLARRRPSSLRYPLSLSLSPRTHARTHTTLPSAPSFPFSLPSSPPFSLRFSISVWLTRNSVERARHRGQSERARSRETSVCCTRSTLKEKARDEDGRSHRSY